MVDFCENERTRIFSDIKHLENSRKSDPQNDFQKSIFEHAKMLFPVVWDPKKTIFMSIVTLKVAPYDQGFRLVVIGDPQHISKFFSRRKSNIL